MDTINVAHFIGTNFFGGPEKQIVTHAQLLDKSRYRIVLISFVENEQHNELLHNARKAGLDVVELHTVHAFDLSALLKLRQALSERGINLLCSHGYKANIIGRLASWGAGIPHLAVSRGWTAENRRIRFYEKLDKFFLRLADRVVAVSEGQRQKILKLGVNPDRVTVIHNAIDLSAADVSERNGSIRQELSIPEDAIFVASAGRLSPEKNQAAMIEAARIVCSKRKDVYFAVFGEGFLRAELEAAISKSGLEERFLLPGFTKDILAVFRGIDIFMLPSFTEGLPNVVLEAFAVRKPIVASNVGGIPEVVQHGVSGYLTAPDDVAAMAAHLIELSEKPALRQLMGQQGYAHVNDSFCFRLQTGLFEKLYESILD